MAGRPVMIAAGAADTSGTAGLTLYARIAAVAGVDLRPVTACVTARDPGGRVRAVQAIAPRVIARQMDCAAQGGNAGSVLVGMLARHQAVDAVAERIRRRELGNVVLYPVLGSSGGRSLMTSQGIKRTALALAPRCRLVICDGETAGLLSRVEVRGRDSFFQAARAVLDRISGAVLMLGVRKGAEVLDVLLAKDSLAEWPAGDGSEVSGEALAAACAALLARGEPLEAAARGARALVAEAG